MTACGDHAGAIGLLRWAMDTGADPCVCILKIALAYQQMRRWHEALAVVEQATTRYPRDRSGWELMLDIAESAGDRRRAAMACRALVKLAPNHIRAHIVLSQAHMRSGDIPAALRTAEILVRLDPGSAAYHYNKALLCQHRNQIDLAVQEFMLSIWLEPDGPCSESARSFLQDLDALQLNQITLLAGDDTVFRTLLRRNCREAVIARGFALSPVGEQLLQEYCKHDLPDLPRPARVSQYH